jgi:hypothetical protein
MRLALILLLAAFLPLSSPAQETPPPASAADPAGDQVEEFQEWH